MNNVGGMYEFWRSWFAQPMEEKMKHLHKPGRGGFFPPFSESPGYTGKADPKQYWHFRHHEHGLMDAATEDVFLQCLDAADDWMEQHGLDHVAQSVRVEDCVLRILHYPPTADGQVGEAHRDFDLLTVSVPATAPGLEVWEHSSNPIWLPHFGGVHVGEMLEILTEGKHQATLHRVVTPPNTERYSAAFFMLPPRDFVLRPALTAAQYLDDTLAKAGTLKVGT